MTSDTQEYEDTQEEYYYYIFFLTLPFLVMVGFCIYFLLFYVFFEHFIFFLLLNFCSFPRLVGVKILLLTYLCFIFSYKKTCDQFQTSTFSLSFFPPKISLLMCRWITGARYSHVGVLVILTPHFKC